MFFRLHLKDSQKDKYTQRWFHPRTDRNYASIANLYTLNKKGSFIVCEDKKISLLAVRRIFFRVL